MVDARGLHSFVCKKAPGKTIRHHSLNDLIAHSFSAAGVPVEENFPMDFPSFPGKTARRFTGM